MKILHTSDWHLGASEQNYSLHEDQVFFINQICEVIKKEDVDIVVIAGDVFDRSVASSDAINLYDMAMERLCVELGLKVITVAGNHDSSDRLSNCNALLERAGLYIQGAIESEPTIINCEDTDFYLLPWFTEEKVRTLYPEQRENIKDITDAYQLVCDKCRETFNPSKRHIAVSHAFLSNSETSTSDRAAVIGFATQVPVSVFNGFDYVALGHIHKPQDVGDIARYSGTPMPYSFGVEERQEKSVTIINTADMSRKIVPLKLLHPRNTINGTLEEVLAFECSDEIQKGYIRVEINDQYLGLEVVSRLNAKYPNILSYSGKAYEQERSVINMTMEEYRELESDPVAIFENFCKDITGAQPDEHLISIFKESMGGEE